MEEHLRGLGYLELGEHSVDRPMLLVDVARRGMSCVCLSQPGANLARQMDAAVWTAIGLLAATSLGTLFYLGSRMDALAARLDALAARLDARMDAGFARVDAGFARVDTRFDAVESRFDGLASRLDAHLDQHAT